MIPAWAWRSPAAGRILATRDLGVILRAFRQAHRLSQQQLADLLGYDRTYICMIERGRRSVTDRRTLALIARKLAIPPHVLGISDQADADFASMLQFAASAIRLADVARLSGRAADSVSELWPLIARLEARMAEGHAEREVAILLARARTSFGVSLGHVLPDERLATAARWTGKALRITRQLDDPLLLAYVLRMHGNELRKASHPTAAIVRLQNALRISDDLAGQGAGLILLARAAAEAGHTALFADAISRSMRLLDATPEHSALFSAFTIREVRIRGLLATGQTAAAVTLATSTPQASPPPTPQWRVIERITTADVLASAGDTAAAAEMLSDAVSQAETLRLPHQVQRVIRLTSHSPGLTRQPVTGQARAALSRLRAELEVGPAAATA
jgi:transcriptional regulator with XRE-family HTH domain